MHSDHVKIESPCHESWDAMKGEGARRFCGVCQKHVHNLSAMGHDEARALLAARASETLCVRYSSETDGTLRFRDLVPRASLTRRIVRTAFAAAALAACAPHGEAPLQGLGEAVIEALREQARPSDGGGCDVTTGPFTTFHLPPGHVLCAGVGESGSSPPPPTETPISPSLPDMGEMKVPAIAAEPEREVQGQMMAAPDPKPVLVPCDPKVETPPRPRPPLRPTMGARPPPPPREDVGEKMGKMQMPIDDL